MQELCAGEQQLGFKDARMLYFLSTTTLPPTKAPKFWPNTLKLTSTGIAAPFFADLGLANGVTGLLGSKFLLSLGNSPPNMTSLVRLSRFAFIPHAPEPMFVFTAGGRYYSLDERGLLRFDSKFVSIDDFLARFEREIDYGTTGLGF
ncbi:hypothetical protein B0H16DRAFT_1466595 [Mycena metata]|uniref:Uncharacterized protein n=1 Tax=Mycena metata TaxID=1033252 RepID=A0AAD7I854_9AGAR|nr:hypothetical protein B0H16DRAFT_1466595 [Mycena metata]